MFKKEASLLSEKILISPPLSRQHNCFLFLRADPRYIQGAFPDEGLTETVNLHLCRRIRRENAIHEMRITQMPATPNAPVPIHPSPDKMSDWRSALRFAVAYPMSGRKVTMVYSGSQPEIEGANGIRERSGIREGRETSLLELSE